MIVAGCDVGSLTAKAVILDENTILASQIIQDAPEPETSARQVMDLALKQAGISMDSIAYCVGTGYGRNQIPFADAVESEIFCHGKGAQWNDASIRMVIDIGGQDAKAIRLDAHANVIRYIYNDKCASGTGRFLDVMADALDIGIEEMGRVSQTSKSPVTISNQCVIFAETEIISLVNEGKPMPDIISGLHRALAHRVAALAKSIELEEHITFTGGVAKNPGMVASLEAALGRNLIKTGLDPQINGALGAALIAQKTIQGKS